MSKAVGKSAVIVLGLTVVQKLLGFVREATLAHFYGTSVAVDALSMANSAAEIFMGLLTAVGLAFLPFYSKIVVSDGREDGNRFMNQLLTLLALVGTVMGVVVMICARPLTALVAPGFEGEVYELSVLFLRINVWYIVLQSMAALFLHFLNYQEAYLLSAAAGLVVSPLQIVLICGSAVCGKELLGYTYLISSAVYLLLLFLFSRRYVFRLHPCLWPLERFRPVFVMLLPIFCSSIIGYVNLTVDKVFGSYLAEGSVSALNYAFNIRSYLIEFLSILISTIVFPMLTKAAAAQDIPQIRSIAVKGIRYILILYVPITVAIVLLARPVLQFLLGSGAFDEVSLRLSTSALLCYIVGIVGVAFREFFQKLYYSIQRTKILIVSWLTTMLVNITGNFLLVRRFGVGGLAMATSISVLAAAVVLYVPLCKHLEGLKTKGSLLVLFKCCIAAIGMSIPVVLCQTFLFPALPTGRVWLLFYLLLVAAIGSGMYFLLLHWLRVKESHELLQLVLQRRNRNKSEENR